MQELSLNRANSVKEAIVRKFPSLQPNQFSTAGHGMGPSGGSVRSGEPRQEPARRDQGVSGGGDDSRRSRCRPTDTGAVRAADRAAPDDAPAGRRGGDRRGRAGLVAGDAAAAAPRTGWCRRSFCRARRKCARSFPSLLNERALLQSIAATLKRVLIGFGLAALVGVPLGIVAGSWRVVEAAGAPLALFGRNLPVAALIPLTILWFGIDETQKMMFIFIACVPFVYRTPSRDRRACPIATSRRRRRSARRRCRSSRKVLVALALPDIYNSLRHLFGLAFGYIMLAELINAEHGLGYLLMTSQRRGLSEHIILILHDHRRARVRHRSPAVLVSARTVSPPRGRGLTPVAEPALRRRASRPTSSSSAASRSGSATLTVIRDVTFAVPDLPGKGEFVAILVRRAAGSRRCCG